jgi:Fe-S cluster assembly ATP-binding protein
MLQLKNVVFKVSETDLNTEELSELTIIDDMSFTFERGGFYAITGPN